MENAPQLGPRVFAIDCEMCVGTEGQKLLLQVAIVDSEGRVMLDDVCRPDGPVYDYLTKIHGIDEACVARSQLSCRMLRAKARHVLFGNDETLPCTIVGHNVGVDLEMLEISDRAHMMYVRDTAKFPLFQKLRLGLDVLLQRKLREIVKDVTGLEIQAGGHSPVEDAAAVMLLYLCVFPLWESLLRKRGSLDLWYRTAPVKQTHIPCVYMCELHMPYVYVPVRSFGRTREQARAYALALAWNVMMRNFEQVCIPRTREIASIYTASMFGNIFFGRGLVNEDPTAAE